MNFRVSAETLALIKEGFGRIEYECPTCPDGQGWIPTTARGEPSSQKCPRCRGTGIRYSLFSTEAREYLADAAAERAYPGKSVEEAGKLALAKLKKAEVRGRR